MVNTSVIGYRICQFPTIIFINLLGVQVREPDVYNFLWVKNFPLFEETEQGSIFIKFLAFMNNY